MITEIWIDGSPLDLYIDTKIKHTLQVNDVAEVKDRQSSYTESFTIPKTARNIFILSGLGIHSSKSLLPYQKPNALLKLEGFDFLTNAWLNVKETDEEYKIYIYSGIIEFFKKFENATIGGSLKEILTEIDHNKNLSTVANTQTDDTLKYTYLFTDFNGRTHRSGDSTVLNIDFIVPSVLVSYLFEKVHEFAEYSFTGNFIGTDDYENWWLSYPKAPEDTSAIVYFSDDDAFTYSFQGQNNQQSGTFNFTFNNGGLPGIKILESGVYNFNTAGGVGVDAPFPSGVSGTASVDFFYSINGGSLIYIPNASTFTMNLSTDDVIEFHYTVYSDWNGGGAFGVVISKLEDVSFTEELNDLKITDFLKDVYNFLGITPFIDNVNKTINYKTNQERFKSAQVEDWSDNLVSIDKESYSISGSYAKQNYFRYKYNDQEESHSDGYFAIENDNYDATKTVFSSYTYSPEKIPSKYYLNASNTIEGSVFKLYEKEAQDGSTTVKYKPLSKRYFYLRMRKVTMSVTIGSDIQNANQTLSVIKLGEFSKLTMDYFIGKYYNSFLNIVNHPVIWNVTLNVPYPKLLKLDLSKSYYFNQLQQYCIINKISFDDDSVTAELIKINDFKLL